MPCPEAAFGREFFKTHRPPKLKEEKHGDFARAVFGSKRARLSREDGEGAAGRRNSTGELKGGEYADFIVLWTTL